jgi:hypothetical protein
MSRGRSAWGMIAYFAAPLESAAAADLAGHERSVAVTLEVALCAPHALVGIFH